MTARSETGPAPAGSVLITGASTGFGANVALEMAGRGWRVFASMRDPARGDALRARAEAKGVGDAVEILQLDVCDADSIERAVADMLDRTGGAIDALLNNAGYSILGAFEDLGDADCRRQMETNFFGVLGVTRAILPAMRRAQRGRIVVVTSNAVNAPHPMLSMYAASKWALEGWAEGLAMEVAPFGIDVRVVQPGAHRTPFAGNVVPVVPEGSAYRRWMEMAAPGIGNLDGWGRDPARATAPIVRALAEADAPFRQTVGEDTAVFAALKGALPYEARTWLMRAIVDLPAPYAFVDGSPAEEGAGDVLDQVVRRVGRSMADAPAGAAGGAAATLAKLLAERSG